MSKPKGLKGAFARFFKEPSRETLRALLQENFGETDYLDFKAQWPNHASFIEANSGNCEYGTGAAFVVGVNFREDKTLDPIGLQTLTDKADIHNGIKNYLPDKINITKSNAYDFSFDASEY